MTKKNLHEQPGLVISYFGNSVAVEAEDGQVFQCHLRRNQALPVVGDQVWWQLDNAQTGTITRIAPRFSLLSRGEAQGKLKAIAANLNWLVIVMAPLPIFSEYLLDRYLVAAELLEIAPVILLNKIDLLSDEDKAKALARLAPYQAIGYPVLLSSVITQEGLTALRDLLQDKTAVLVGPSGVGKSSIIACFSSDPIRVGDVSMKGTGRHTTTATRLYHLPNGGHLIDSPGVREFTLWPVTAAEILRGFKEFEAYIGDCKFRDCQHLVEPNCAVREAVLHGKISPERYKNYQTLRKEIKKNY